MAAPKEEQGGGRSLFEELSEANQRNVVNDEWPEPVTVTDNVSLQKRAERDYLPSRYKRNRKCISVYFVLQSFMFTTACFHNIYEIYDCIIINCMNILDHLCVACL